MSIGCKETGFNVTSNIAVYNDQIYTDAYFVVEHQPDDCGEYPSNGQITFTDIHIVWEKPNPVKWQGFTYQDACNCQPIVQSPTAVQFTWNTSSK
jgi:hypothetical protein